MTSQLSHLCDVNDKYGPDMIFARHDPGCTLFYSPMHNRRPVVIVTGKVIFYKSRGEHTYLSLKTLVS